MRLEDIEICGIKLGFSRAELEPILGPPSKINPILDDEETSLIYNGTSSRHGPLFGTPRDGLVIRLDSAGRVRLIQARRSNLVLGNAQIRMSDTYEEVRSVLEHLDADCQEAENLTSLTLSDAKTSLRTRFRAGRVFCFELGRV